MKKLLFWLLSSLLVVSFSAWITSVVAQNLEIIPSVDNNKIGEAQDRIITWDSETVRDKYRKEAKGLSTEEQIVSGIMTRDTILNYGVVLLKFLSQAGLAVGWLMFIYTGYKYIMSVITWDSEPSKDLIRNAIIGILVIIFSYAIMRILTRTFLV